MAKQRVVNTYFWSDDFILDLKVDEKLLFLYILTNPQTDLCGAYEIAMQKIVFETKITEKRIRAILDKFERAGKACYRDGWMIVRNFKRHQSSSSIKVAKGIERSLSHCPDWVKECLQIGFDRVCIPSDTKPHLNLNLNLNLTDVCAAAVSDQEIAFAETVMAGLRDRFGTNQLRDEGLWSQTIEFAFINHFSPEEVLETFDLLRQQKWRKGRISPKTLGDNLPELARLRAETAETDEQIRLNQDRPTRDVLASIGASPAEV